MKFAFGTFIFIWLLCGAIGAWMLDDLDAFHWKKTALGPITLIEAINGEPIKYPWEV